MIEKKIQKAVKELGMFTTPHKLAEFLKTDVELIYHGIEKGYIGYVKGRNYFLIKTADIFFFLKKFSLLIN